MEREPRRTVERVGGMIFWRTGKGVKGVEREVDGRIGDDDEVCLWIGMRN